MTADIILFPKIELTCRTTIQRVYLANVVSAKPFPLTHFTGAALQWNDGGSTITAKGFRSIMHYAPIVVRFAEMLDLAVTKFVEIVFFA